MPKPPSEEPEAKHQSNLTDPDSRLVRKHKWAEFEQAYGKRPGSLPYPLGGQTAR